MRGKLLLPQFHSRNCASWNQGQLSTVPVCLPVHTILSLPFYNTWPELFTLLHSSAGKMVSKCLPYSFNPGIAYYERFVSCIQQRIPSQNRFGGTIYSILSHQKGPMKLPMKELLSIIKSSNCAREAQWIRITFKDVLTFSKGKTQKTKGKSIINFKRLGTSVMRWSRCKTLMNKIQRHVFIRVAGRNSSSRRWFPACMTYHLIWR